jgi:hypothetical protein|nr:MAG TPA: hypothetical protein [Caudoviricetes sp.]DAM40420.1 MAG TPA: hypothetical protein [Caudoviricetes sp.]
MARIEFNESAIKELLSGSATRADIQRRIDAVRQTAAGMYGASNYKGDVITTDRAHGAVWVGDTYAARSCAKHNTLLKALDAGKG